MDKEQQARRILRKIGSIIYLIIVVIGTGLILMFGAMFAFFLVYDWQIAHSRSPGNVEDWKHIIPDTATDIHIEESFTFQSHRVRIRFTIHGANLPDFIAHVCPNMALTEGGYNHLYNLDDIEWWKPENAKSFAIGECVDGNITKYTFLIDKTDKDSFLIYLQL